MEDGPHGVRGLHVVSPVVQEHALEAECVTTQHHNMVERTAPVKKLRLKTARRKNVPVSILARNGH